MRLVPVLLATPSALARAIGLVAERNVSVVQPELRTTFVFVVIIRAFVMHWAVRTAAWGSAALLSGWSDAVRLVPRPPRRLDSLTSRGDGDMAGRASICRVWRRSRVA
jgi:hypothetical protein